jgi:hypothetical protein
MANQGGNTMFGFFRSKWIGKRSKPSHVGTLTEADLQQHLVDYCPGIGTKAQAKETLDCIERYFIKARKDGKNAVWFGWFTLLCMRSSDGKERTKVRWHKPYRDMLRKISI